MSKSQQAQRAPALSRAAPAPATARSPATAGNAAAAEQVATLQTRSASTAKQGAAPTAGVADTARPTGSFAVLGQRFGSLQALHDWLVAQASDPQSTVPHEPVLKISVTPGSMVHATAQTDWSYYAPSQKVVIDGGGAIVSGLRRGAPTPGFFLAYRPNVGPDSSEASPAKANFELRGLTIRGFESGGVELSPQAGAGKDHRWDAGIAAFMEGAVIEGNRFERLGSKDTPEGEANWAKQRYGVGGVLARGLSGATIQDNVFDTLVNEDVEGASGKDGAHLIHAVYLRDHSSGNSVTGNTFKDVSGDPVRVSNASNGNRITGNTAQNSGHKAFMSEFYNPTAHEADSTGNIVSGNRTGNLFRADAKTQKAKKAKASVETVSRGKRAELAD